MLASRAAIIAARRRGLAPGSGAPRRAAVVISRISLVKIFALAASCRPLRCMMFLNWEWPAIALTTRLSEVFGRLYHFSCGLGLLETGSPKRAAQKKAGAEAPAKKRRNLDSDAPSNLKTVADGRKTV